MSFLMENWQNSELAAIRVGFGEGLVDIAKKNNLVVALSADLMESVGFGQFDKEIGHPRAIEVGVAEQNLVTVASGLAAMGNIPFAASYAAFSPGRNWEQIRTTICLNNQPVKLIGSHAGLNVGPDGATHQMLEDIALMRSLPNMVVLAPGDANEAKAIYQLFGGNTPVSSTKGLTGHECWMAGASEIVYSVIMMQHSFIAPNLNFETADADSGRLRIIAETTPQRIDTFLSNSFGFGGTNSAIIVRQL